MSQNIEIEIYLLIDEDGQYAVATEQEEIVPAYEEEFGHRPATTNHYVLKLSMRCPTFSRHLAVSIFAVFRNRWETASRFCHAFAWGCRKIRCNQRYHPAPACGLRRFCA